MTTQQKRKRLRNKADRLLQEVGRATFDSCLVCGKPISCLHHYFPKSTASCLRYDLQNCIPLCAGCHLQHHNGNPEIHNRVNEIMGEDWLDELRTKKRQNKHKDTLGYYEDIIDLLKKLL